MAALRRMEALAAAVCAAGRPGPPRLEVVAGDPAYRSAARVGLLAGTFNPLTRAHAALAEAAVDAGCDRVVLAMAPASIGKERLERAHPLDRLDWVVTWARAGPRPWAVVAVASHPLLVDMAEAAGAGGARVDLIVGADKAAQLVDPVYYDDPEAALARLGRAASALVAARLGHQVPELPLRAAPLPTPAWAAARSSTQARAAAGAGHSLAEYVPAEILAAVESSRAYEGDGGAYAPRAAALARLLQGAPVAGTPGEGVSPGGGDREATGARGRSSTNDKDPRAARGGQDDARGPFS